MTQTEARATVPYKALREGLRPTPSQRAVERVLGWKTGHLSLIERGLIPSEEQHAQLMEFYVRQLAEADRTVIIGSGPEVP